MHPEVLLFYPPGLQCHTPPLGLAYLAAVLEKNNINVNIFDASVENLSLKETIAKITKINPKIIGITTMSEYYYIVAKINYILKHINPEVKIVLGGAHPTMVPDQVKMNGVVDYLVRGEGEYPFLKVCEYILKRKDYDLTEINNISFMKDDKIIHNPIGGFIQNLDELPFPARHLMPIEKYRNYGFMVKRKPVEVMITSRGCPFNCIFCENSTYGKSYRTHSANKVYQEIKYLSENYGIKEISFMENNFTADPGRVKEFCNLIATENVDISWMCNAHVNSLSEDLLKNMKKAGCWYIRIGVESGNQEIIKIIRKGIDLNHTKEVFKMAQRIGIRTLAFFMVGNYADTRETIKETINYALELDTDLVSFTITVPFPGTALYEMAKKEGLISSDSLERFKVPQKAKRKIVPVLRTKALSNKDLLRYQRLALKKFYLRPKQILRLLIRSRTRHQLFCLFDLVKGFFNLRIKYYDAEEKVFEQVNNYYEQVIKEGNPNGL